MYDLNLENYSLMKCNTGKAIEAVPKEKTPLDLMSIKNKLEEKGAEIEISTPILLIAHLGLPVSVYRSGKIIVKNTYDKEEAKKTISKLFDLIK